MQVFPTMNIILALAILGAAETSVLRFDKLVCDFGTTNPVPSLTGTFTFHNTGAAVLPIRKPTTSCGCAVASVRPDKLPPGGTGELVFTLSLGSGMRGQIEKHIQVQPDLPGAIPVSLAAKVNVVPLYDTDPMQVNLGDLRQGESTNVIVRVWRTDKKPLGAIALQPSQPFIAATLEPLTGTEDAATMRVQIAGNDKPRWLYERVAVLAGNPTQEVAAVNLYGRIVGEVVLSREEIYWAVVKGGTTATRSFRVRPSTPGKKFEISNLASTLKEVQLKANPLPEGQGYDVTIELRQVPAGTTRGEISFTTNLEKQPRVSLPITINVIQQ